MIEFLTISEVAKFLDIFYICDVSKIKGDFNRLDSKDMEVPSVISTLVLRHYCNC